MRVVSSLGKLVGILTNRFNCCLNMNFFQLIGTQLWFSCPCWPSSGGYGSADVHAFFRGTFRHSWPSTFAIGGCFEFGTRRCFGYSFSLSAFPCDNASTGLPTATAPPTTTSDTVLPGDSVLVCINAGLRSAVPPTVHSFVYDQHERTDCQTAETGYWFGSC